MLTTTVQVALVAMPFAPLQTPSLGLGLLHGAMDARSIPTKTFNFSVRFADRIGSVLYDQISDGDPARCDLVGEWIFSGRLFEESAPDIEGYVRDILRGGSPHHRIKRFRSGIDPERWIEQVLEARRHTAPFLDECVEVLYNLRPRIVGLTSMFEEHVAALSLAKRLKLSLPETCVVLGGSNCEGPMGLETARQFPFLDAVVSGEGDLVFPEIVERALAGRPLANIQGVFVPTLVDADTEPTLTEPVEDMDALPYPNFDDHFAEVATDAADFSEIAPPHIMFETARGCWWGQVNHCTFCGLNGTTMAFRSKSPTRALDELCYLTERHPGHAVAVSDNILDHKYLKTFVPALTERNPGVSLFYEVKANLKKEEVRLLRDAGIERIQPGVESFSTPLLKLMRKGVSGLQNIQLLKWCRELGVTPVWGILWGFPGEDPAEYKHMANIVPLLSHLTPPIGVSQIRLDRFSPNHTHAEERGFAHVQPFPSYGYVYPLAEDALHNLAYFFCYDYTDGIEPRRYVQPMLDAAGQWLEDHESSALFFADKGDALIVCDLRPVATQPLFVLSGVLAALYRQCEHASSVSQLRKAVMAQIGEDLAVEDIHRTLRPLLNRGLMVRDGDAYLGLAVPLGEYAISEAAFEQFRRTIDELGEPGEGERVIRMNPVAESVGIAASAAQ